MRRSGESSHTCGGGIESRGTTPYERRNVQEPGEGETRGQGNFSQTKIKKMSAACLKESWGGANGGKKAGTRGGKTNTARQKERIGVKREK